MSIDHPERNYVSSGNYLMPAHQAGENLQRVSFNLIPPTVQPASNVLVAGGKCDFRFLPKDIPGVVRHLGVRIDVLENGTGNANFAPSPNFINKVDWQMPGAQGNVIMKSEFDDTLLFENCCLQPTQKQNRHDINVSDDYGRGRLHKQSTTRPYRFALLSNPFVMNKMHINDLSGEIILSTTFAAGITANGSGVPTVSAIYLEIVSDLPDKKQLQVMRNMFNKNLVVNYLDVIKDETATQTLTASTQYNYNLNAFSNRDVAFFLLGVRTDSFSNTSEGRLKLHSLDGGSIDLQDSAGRGILANNTQNIQFDFIRREIMPQMLDNRQFSHNRYWYLVPCCKDVKGALLGRKNGFVPMGNNYRLAITPAAAAVSTVQTITLNNPANDGGYYKLAFRGAFTASLAYNATAAAMKAALEALPTWPLGTTVTASGTAAATFTLTFVGGEPLNDPVDYVHLLSESLNDGGVAEFSTTTVSIAGQRGWTTGSTYTITVYAYHYKRLIKNSGRLMISDNKSQVEQ